MDIISKKSSILYEKRSQTASGIIDLRCFSSDVRSTKSKMEKSEGKRKIVSEIVRKGKQTSVGRLYSDKNEKKRLELAGTKNFPISQFLNFPISADNSCESYETMRSASWADLFKPALPRGKSLFYFVFAGLIVSSLIFSLSFIQKAIEQKGEAFGAGILGYNYLKLAGWSATNSEFEDSINSFNSAILSFSRAQETIDKLSLNIAGIVSNLPVNTPLSTAKNLVQAGENISLAGKSFTDLLNKISASESGGLPASFALNLQPDINDIAAYLKKAEQDIKDVNLDYIPENFKEKIKLAKKELPVIADNFENLSKDFPIITELLGSTRQQKYLLLFENNSEIRATGGFIGSYGILDIEDGEIRNLFIDGIFNPDGQLKEKIVPPVAIQKISASWSMHDANWFADFPTSAKKVALFYEKTGGPTVDGVIAITPNVIEKMLKITGPIEMPEYGAIVSAENFIAETQTQVEQLYDKEQNRPKQFLADLAPKIIERLFDAENLTNQEKIQRSLNFFSSIEESLKEKHIILYHRDPDIESMIIKRGWGGQILNSSGDYLSVVHSNINGYKTDAVIDEQITHQAEILGDGSIIDTVKIAREHTGGKSDYDWYNRVNSDYMRVYAPLGSVLLEAQGYTAQNYEPPVDYSDFQTDPDIVKIESTIKIDPATGTQIFEESGKTVFGNWVYVSPGEKVEVLYRYRLPYKIDFDGYTKPADKYSILVQKQTGSYGSKFSGSIKLPSDWRIIWNSQGIESRGPNGSAIETDLRTDRVYGAVFAQKQAQ